MLAFESVAEVAGRVGGRTAIVATANLAGMAGESIPLWGIAVVVAATTCELKSACDSMTDIRALEVATGVAGAGDAGLREVCGLRVPSAAEPRDMVVASPGAAWEAARGALGALDLPDPDVGGRWTAVMARMGGWWDHAPSPSLAPARPVPARAGRAAPR